MAFSVECNDFRTLILKFRLITTVVRCNVAANSANYFRIIILAHHTGCQCFRYRSSTLVTAVGPPQIQSSRL